MFNSGVAVSNAGPKHTAVGLSCHGPAQSGPCKGASQLTLTQTYAIAQSRICLIQSFEISR